VVSLPSGAAARATGALSARGLQTVAVPRARAWTRLPTGFVGLLGSVLAAGTFAAVAAGSFQMIGLAALLAALMGVAGIQAARSPAWIPAPSRMLGVSERVEREVRATLAGLSRGRARGYLKDLVTLSLPLLAPPTGGPGPETSGAVDRLLELGSRAAIDLDQLDRSLGVLEQPDDAGAMDVSVAEAIGRASETRARLVKRFEEALASLARLQVASVETPDELVELAERLAEDSVRRSRAREEVRRLLA
jgi:hypothetical protein